MRKRLRSEGSIYLHGSGSYWVVSISDGTGKRRIFNAGSHRDAENLINHLNIAKNLYRDLVETYKEWKEVHEPNEMTVEEAAMQIDKMRRKSERDKRASARVRFRVLQRDNFTCVYCGGQPPGIQLQVDHVVPLARGGKTEEDNLVAACSECNRGKSATQSFDAYQPPMIVQDEDDCFCVVVRYTRLPGGSFDARTTIDIDEQLRSMLRAEYARGYRDARREGAR